MFVPTGQIRKNELIPTTAAAAIPSDTCGMIVPPALTRSMPLITAHPSVVVFADAIRVLAAVFRLSSPELNEVDKLLTFLAEANHI